MLGRESWSSTSARSWNLTTGQTQVSRGGRGRFDQRARADEESATTFPSSSLSITSHRVGAGSTLTGGEQCGEKRAVEDPPADCVQEDSVANQTFQLQLSKLFFMKSSGMTEQGNCWVPRKPERRGQNNFESSIAECRLELMWKNVGTRKEEGP